MTEEGIEELHRQLDSECDGARDRDRKRHKLTERAEQETVRTI
jgi:hypothetical protein